MLIKRKLKYNRNKTITILTSTLSHDFLVKVVTRYIKVHYEKSQNANFLELMLLP